VSAQAFTWALAAGSAGIALWILARWASFGPKSLVWAGVNVVAAYALLRFVPVLIGAAGDDVALRYAAVFGLALPMFVYVFLSGGWVTRAAVGLLRR
jgi:hypothetical protein